MGRSETQKRQGKSSKVSKVQKQQRKFDGHKSKPTDKQHKRKTDEKNEIQPIDDQGNYVLPAGFEVGQDDLALFDKLNNMQNIGTSLERNIKEFNADLHAKSPAKDPEVIEVYTRSAHKHRRTAQGIQKRKGSTLTSSDPNDGVLGRFAGSHKANRMVSTCLLRSCQDIHFPVRVWSNSEVLFTLSSTESACWHRQNQKAQLSPLPVV